MFFFIMGFALCLLFVQARNAEGLTNTQQAADTIVRYTAEARAIIDQKCYGCHNPEAKNEKAKQKLQWDDLPKNSKQKQLKAVNDILEVLAEGSMPPEKFLQFKPEAKLTETEISALTAWAEENAKRLNQ